MKKFYLVRHAQSESNAGLAIRPNHQINLTTLGQTQAQEVANWLMDNIGETVADVFVSCYVRTEQTAKPYLDKLGKTAKVIKDLHEFNYLEYGHIQNMTFGELIDMADKYWEIGDIHHKDGEHSDSFMEFVERVANVRAYFESLPDGVYVVFGHGMWLGMLLWQLLHGTSRRVLNIKSFRQFELAVRPKNCEVYLWTMDDHQGISKVRVRNEE